MELYIVRHGKTRWNAAGRFQGSADIELIEEGREAARHLGAQLASTPIDRIYSSPLCRAYETACLIRGDRDIEILRDDRLRELSFGDMEGCTYAEWDVEDKPYHYLFQEPDKYLPPPNGETLEKAMDRAKDFLVNTIEPLADEGLNRIMIVAHGALNKSLMCYLENNDKAHYWGDGLQQNCQATIFSFDGQHWTRL